MPKNGTLRKKKRLKARRGMDRATGVADEGSNGTRPPRNALARGPTFADAPIPRGAAGTSKRPAEVGGRFNGGGVRGIGRRDAAGRDGFRADDDARTGVQLDDDATAVDALNDADTSTGERRRVAHLWATDMLVLWRVPVGALL